MYIYIPAIVALLIKFFILYYSRSALLNSRLTKTFAALLVVLTIANVLELLSYYYTDSLLATLVALKIYYASLVLLCAFLLQISILVCNSRVSKITEILNYSLAIAVIGWLMLTDHIIVDAVSIGYTVTRVPGNYFIAIQLYGVLTLLSAIGICIYGYRRAEPHYSRIQAMYVLLSVFFLALPIFAAIILMFFDIKINAAILLPIGVSFFLVIMTYGLNAEGLYDIRVWIPGTVMFGLHRSLHEEFMLNYDGSQMTAKERIQAHERRYIIQALIQANGSQKKAAQLLQVSESTISLKRKKYNI